MRLNEIRNASHVKRHELSILHHVVFSPVNFTVAPSRQLLSLAEKRHT